MFHFNGPGPAMFVVLIRFLMVPLKLRKLQTTTDGHTKSGKAYKNEHIFTFRFELKSGQIVSVKEFVDSKYLCDALAAEEEARKHV